MPLSSENVIPDVWSAVKSTKILLNHIGRIINMSLNLGKLPHNSGILIQDTDAFDG